MVKSFEEQTKEALEKAKLLVLDIDANELKSDHPMEFLFNELHNAFKAYHIVNDITIAAAVHDAKIDHEKKNDNSLEGFEAVNQILSILADEKVNLESMKDDYQDLKKAVYETHVLGVGKDMKEKAATVVKNAGRVVAGIFAQAFHLTGESLKLVGNLVKLAPIAGYAIDRLPGLSYTTETREGLGSTGKHHNFVEGLGEEFKEVSKKLTKIAMPVHSKKNEVLLKIQQKQNSFNSLSH